MKIQSTNTDVKLYLAKNMTKRGLHEVQKYASIQQANTRMSKHKSHSVLGTKRARRKKNKEKPYGDALAKVKFWAEVKAFKGQLDLLEMPKECEELENQTQRVFDKYSAPYMELIKDENGRLLVIKKKFNAKMEGI